MHNLAPSCIMWQRLPVLLVLLLPKLGKGTALLLGKKNLKSSQRFSLQNMVPTKNWIDCPPPGFPLMYSWVKSKGAHAPPGWPPGILTFFFGRIPHHAGPFLWSNAPLPRKFLGVKCPAPPGWSDKNPDWFQETWMRFFNTCHFLLFFCIPVQRLRSSFFFCVSVHSDHLGTLQSSVSKTRRSPRAWIQYIPNFVTQVFSESSLPSGFNYWQRSKSFEKCT